MDSSSSTEDLRQFWLEKNPEKRNHPKLREKLEAWSKSGENMHGFSLPYCPLQHINLVDPNHKGYDMSEADLYHADLTGAHLFSVDLHNASLMKADLSAANLHCANLEGCNLLGVKLDNTKLDNIRWGDKLRQEKQGTTAKKAGNLSLAKDYFQQAEETYRNIRLQLEKSGLFEQAGTFFYREMLMRRYQLPLFSLSRLASFIIGNFCGYGEKPLRVIGFSLLLIILCTLVYFLSAGIIYNGEHVGFNPHGSTPDNILDFFSCLYFSIVTFTTLGYGDFTPAGPTRIMAAIEAFSGSFTIALFVVVFVKKMSR